MDHMHYFDKVNHLKLFVDYGYQRPVSNQKVNMMKSNFDEKALTTLVVSKREDGTFAIIDGQHRYKAGFDMGIEFFYCQVFINLTYQQEADLFYKLNVQRGIVKSTLQFKASLEAGHDKSENVKNIVERNGFKLEFVKSTKSKNMIACVDKLLKAYEVGSDHLELVLNTLRKAYDGDKKSLTHFFIEGISLFLKNYFVKIDYDRFIRILKTNTIDSLVINSKKRKEYDGGRLGTCIEIELLNLYNKGLRNKVKNDNKKSFEIIDGEAI